MEHVSLMTRILHFLRLAKATPAPQRIDREVEERELTAEWEEYMRILPKIEDRRGRYALMASRSLIGIFDAYRDAVEAGYERYGTTRPFLVQQVGHEEAAAAYMNFEAVRDNPAKLETVPSPT